VSMFNDEQRDEMRWLAEQPPASLCWCGWYTLGSCPHCPKGLTAADKVAHRCPECRSAPDPSNIDGPITHVRRCSLGGTPVPGGPTANGFNNFKACPGQAPRPTVQTMSGGETGSDRTHKWAQPPEWLAGLMAETCPAPTPEA
jgi:hypothetical protein